MSFSKQDGVIWLDGEFVPWQEAKIHVLTHTLHYGLGVFEGIRGYQTEQGTAIFRLEEHMQRLFDSAKILNMPMPYDKATLSEVAKEVVRKNNLDSAYIRPMCFYGDEGMGLHTENLQTHVMIAAWHWGAYLGKEALEKGIRIMTSSFIRHHPNSLMGRAKANGHYINSMLALQEAQRCGCDEALLLDTRGFVAEGSGENFFMIRKGTVYTPPLNSIIEGITRDTIINLFAEMNIPVVVKDITRDEVYTADEAFFTGTAAEVTPIRELDGRPIGTGTCGPITKKIQKNYFDQVHGRRDAYPEWLTLV